MKRISKKYAGMITAALLAVSLSVGCAAAATDVQTAAQGVTVTGTDTATVTASVTQSDTGSTAALSEMFTSRDLEQTADLSGATYITVSDNQTVDITTAGVYVISGTAKNATIKVNVTKEEKVQLVLDGVNITNTSAPAIYVVEGDKVFVTTAENSENKLSVTGAFVADGETNTDAVIFSKADTVLNGLGELTISSTGNGVTSKDDLKVTGGVYVITSAGDALEANEQIAISGGDFTINSSKDGLHAENSDDLTQGEIYISGGNFTINAADDGIQGTTSVTIDDGNMSIAAAEGIEATQVIINGGDITIAASDDGINATAKTTALSTALSIHGGNVDITMAAGDTDGLDSNGALTITGGNINIQANSAFDYDGAGTLTGGTLTVNGQTVTQLTQSMPGGGGGMGPRR